MFTLVIPFHSDVVRLEQTFERIRDRERFGIAEVLLCHNGRRLCDDVWGALSLRLPPGVSLLHTDAAGIGAGYRLGIANATQPTLVLSASDLPFGFSDIEAFAASQPTPRFAIGSKLHPRSDVKGYPARRRFASHVFYATRALLLGASTPRDSQGTLLLETDLGRRLVRDVGADDYFFSLELVTLAARAGVAVTELPVKFHETDATSSVSLLRDAPTMLLRLWNLRRRLRAGA